MSALLKIHSAVDAGWAEVVDDAEDLFWEGVELEGLPPDVEEMGQFVFDFWFAFDFELEPGRFVVDAFLEEEPGLSPGERRFLLAARETVMRPYEILEAAPGASLTLAPLLGGDAVRVREQAASAVLHRGDVIVARVMQRGASGQPELDGGVLPMQPWQREPLIRQVEETLKEYAGESGELECYKELVPFFNQLWLAAPALPALVNFEGDPLLFTRVHFEVIDDDALTKKLDEAHDLDRDGIALSWSWSGTVGDREEETSFGRVELRANRLMLETSSAARGERGRELLEGLAGDAVRYLTTELEDPMQALAGLAAMGDRDEVPEEEREAMQQAAESYMAAHYERWIDEPVPRLDGRTPREAAASAELRERVAEMVRELEGMYERALERADAAYDPSWMWAELGLLPERDATRGKRLPFGHESLAERGVVTLDTESARAATELLRDFELHGRKVLTVDEPLAWMLNARTLDARAEALEPPFDSFALIFHDRCALGLAERVVASDPDARLRGRMLRVLSVYITRQPAGMRLTLVADALDGGTPHIHRMDLSLAPEVPLTAVAQNHAGGKGALRELLELCFKAILHAKDAGARERAGVHHLAGDIDAAELRTLQRARRTAMPD